MSEKNPIIALDAALEAPVKLSDKVTVYEMSLGRYSLLELINSPFVVPDQQFTIGNLVPTFYIMCSEYKDLIGYNSKNLDKLNEKALIWAEDFDVDVAPALIDQIADKLGLLKKVSPQASGEESDGKVTTSKKEDPVMGSSPA